mgnify:CR=1 FL=1
MSRVSRREETREVAYAVQAAASWPKKRTKDVLEGIIASQAKEIVKQARELHDLRAQVAEANKKLEQYAAIERALHMIAHARLKRDGKKPRPEAPLPCYRLDIYAKTVNKDSRTASHAQALAAELARIGEAIGDLKVVDEERDEMASERVKWERESEAFLNALGMDDFEWRRVGWKF